MPLATVKFAPGFDKQSTAYGAEGKWIDGENIRFRYGQPEKIGGWVKLVANKLYGSVRAQFAWSTLDGTRFLALGTDKKSYTQRVRFMTSHLFVLQTTILQIRLSQLVDHQL